MTALHPKVSVLIPTYNYARYLPEAIESVLQQDFTDFELIISDDCSTDGSAQLLHNYAAHDPRIRVHIHQPNLGMVANWNWCLQQASGEYIKYLFGDDCFASRWSLGRMVAMLDETPRASLAASARFTINEASNVTGIWDELRTNGLHDGAATIARCLNRSFNLIGEPSVVLFRREAGLRGFAPNLRQIVDLEMWFHLLLNGDAVYTNSPLCCFRQHGVQQTVINRESQAGDLEMAGILREYLPRLNTPTHPLSTWTQHNIQFRALIQLLKKDAGHTGLANEIKWLSDQLPPTWRALCWANYRCSRPVENLRRSSHKRLLCQKLKRRYARYVSFLQGLRASAGTPNSGQ